MKAIFEIEFDKDLIIDEEALNEYYGGDMLKVMQELWDEDGEGIFDERPKLVRVED